MSTLGPGDEVGGYRVERLLGSGGMGRVYVAADAALGRHVALKVISDEAAHDDEFRERFAREARQAAAIDHPHIIPVYGFGDDGGRLWLAMRLVEGPDLQRLLNDPDPIPVDRLLRIISQVAGALDALHERGLIHRDVKPANVLVDSPRTAQPHAYLTDFGIAVSAAATRLTKGNSVLGTLTYAAPEHLRGEPIDHRADQYSLACLAFACLTGEPPFLSDTEAGLLYAHLEHAPPHASAVRSELPAAVDAPLIRGLAKYPGDRWPTCTEFAAALDAALAAAEPSSDSSTRQVGEPMDSTPLADAARDATVDLAALPTGASPRPDPSGASPSVDPDAVDDAPEPATTSPPADPRPHRGRGLWLGAAAALLVVVGALLLLANRDTESGSDDATVAGQDGSAPEASPNDSAPARGEPDDPGALPGELTGVSDVVAADAHTCARIPSGPLWCWGRNDAGQLGSGATGSADGPVAVEGASEVAALDAGASHTCAHLEDGTVRCWGSNDDGKLGDGSDVNQPAPVAVAGIDNATGLSVGGEHSCALRADGSIACWGQNGFGQLGDGSTLDQRSPVAVDGLDNAVQVVASGGRTCAQQAAGQVWCWGQNGFGELGDGTTEDRSQPVEVVGLRDVDRLTLGGAQTCALLARGTVMCWGRNDLGQLGDGTTADSAVPVEVVGLADATSIGVEGGRACARRASGQVVCWGRNDRGQVGDGTTENRSSPVTVAGIGDAVDVVVGTSHTCALASGGRVHCWGANDRGQLGNGTAADSPTPVEVAGLDDATALVAGPEHTCAVRRGGRVVCWGANDAGQASGTAGDDVLEPVAIVVTG